MRAHTLLTLTSLCLASLALATCGGGSTSTASGVPNTSALVTAQGVVLSRDGTTDTLGGVDVYCPETGSTWRTDAAGRFRCDVPSDRPFRIAFHDPAWPDAPRGDGPAEDWDPSEDGTEVDGPIVTCRPDAVPEWCEVEVHLEDGEIVECHVHWYEADGETSTGEVELDCGPAWQERGTRGEVEAEWREGCLHVELDFDGVEAEGDYDVCLRDEAGQTHFVDDMHGDARGIGHAEWTWCEGEALPFGHTSPADCLGYDVVVFDDAGDVVMEGHLPHRYDQDPEHHHDGMGDGGMGMGGPRHGR